MQHDVQSGDGGGGGGGGGSVGVSWLWWAVGVCDGLRCVKPNAIIGTVE
jgi:hypothetical protein